MNLSLLNISQNGLNTLHQYVSRYNGSRICENFETTRDIVIARNPFSF